MRSKQVPHVCCLAWLGLALLACLGTPPAARADDPVLAIRLTGGERAVYAVAEIERIGFDGGATLFVEWAGGSQSYPAASIVKIEFTGETQVSRVEIQHAAAAK